MDATGLPCHQVPGMGFSNAVLFASAAAPDSAAALEEGAGATLALFLLVVLVAAWLAMRAFVRSLRARKAERAIGRSFPDYSLEALVNAAKIDGRANDDERRAIASAIVELGGPAYTMQVVDEAFAKARLTKDELVAYLAARAKNFSRDQKVALLKSLLSVFVADGRFDEREHHALVDYTEAVGFDRQGAPDMLRGLARDFTRGNIT